MFKILVEEIINVYGIINASVNINGTYIFLYLNSTNKFKQVNILNGCRTQGRDTRVRPSFSREQQ